MSNQKNLLYAITGITGKVGGATAQALLDAGRSVRAVGRDPEKVRIWAEKGCEVVLATNTDVDSLTQAFTGVDGVFLMLPPLYDPAPGFPEVAAPIAAARAAIETARPGKVVLLSTVGAQVERANLLNALKLVEEGLRDLDVPIAFLRAGWFMENSAWDVTDAKAGHIHSYLRPLDHEIPMIATRDIGQIAAELLRETWTGLRIVELEAERRYSANDIAEAFAQALGHPVTLDAIPRETWEEQFVAQGTKNPSPRIQMIDGFNEGWIDFEGAPAEHRTGPTPLSSVIRELVAVP